MVNENLSNPNFLITHKKKNTKHTKIEKIDLNQKWPKIIIKLLLKIVKTFIFGNP